MRHLLPSVALVLLSGCADKVYEATGFPYTFDNAQPTRVPATARVIRVSGTLYRRLTGETLRRAVVGHFMHFDGSVITESGMSHYGGRWFAADGHTYYWSRFRLGHGRGTYAIGYDAICTSGTTAPCFALYRSADGRFLRNNPAEGAPALVVLRPIDPSWSPRLQPE
jgi:hypothetical protein